MEIKPKPNFFIAGMPRSGTTSLYTYLKQHPDIYLALYKEPHFFGTDLTRGNPYNIEDEEVYYSLFEHAGNKTCIGEGSVWYLTSKTAAAEINAFNPEAKIIAMLRKPLEMIYSLHSLYVRTGNDDVTDFQQAVEIQAERMKGKSLPTTCYYPEGLLYTEVAKYYEKLKRFIDAFGKERVHVIVFDDFSKDTPRCYRETLEFLELDSSFPAEFDLEKADRLIRPQVLQQIRGSHPEVKRKLANKTGLKAHKSPKRNPLPPEFISALNNLFRDDIEKTGQLIGRDLRHWVN